MRGGGGKKKRKGKRGEMHISEVEGEGKMPINF